MPPFRTIIAALCICISAASAGALPTCPTNANFKLEASGTKKYLTPGFPCEPNGCYAFFSANGSTGFEYTIAAGTTNLMIAKVPAGSQTPAGLYADAHDYQARRLLGVMFSAAAPTNMNCTIVPDDNNGSCNLVCHAAFHDGEISNGQSSIDTQSSNMWDLGRSTLTKKIAVKVRYT